MLRFIWIPPPPCFTQRPDLLLHESPYVCRSEDWAVAYFAGEGEADDNSEAGGEPGQAQPTEALSASRRVTTLRGA